MAAVSFPSVDAYMKSLAPAVEKAAQELRALIKAQLPAETEEVISYQIPAFRLNGKTILYYSGNKSHLGTYPIPDLAPDIRERLEPYVHGKGTLRFSLDEPLPKDLIVAIAKGHLAGLGR